MDKRHHRDGEGAQQAGAIVDRRGALRRLGAAAIGCVAVACERKAPPATPPPAAAPVQAPPPPQPPQPSLTAADCRGTLIGMARMLEHDGSERFAVVLVDLHDRPLKVRPIAIDFYGHGVAFDPTRPERALVFEKHGPGCAEVDLRVGRMMTKVKTTEDRQFYGHGVFSPDGTRLYCTETMVADGSRRGVVAIRDGRSLALIGTLPSHGLAPHDMVLRPDGKALIITNGGGGPDGEAPNVAVVGIPDGELIERLPFADPRVNAGHVALLPGGGLVTVSAPRDGLDVHDPTVHGDISFWRPSEGKSLRSPGGPEIAKMRAETLSVAVHGPSGQVVATNPDGNHLSFWGIADGKLRHVDRSFVKPRGVTLDLGGKCLAVSHGMVPALTLLDPATHRALKDGVLDQAWFSGSHLFVHDLGPAKG